MPYSDVQLAAYLDEALSAEEMARVEDEARRDPQLTKRLASINARRDAGAHTLGEIWRRHRLTCPSRPTLGCYLLGALDEGQAKYIEFHLRVIGCRPCLANVADLENQQAEAVASRRRRYFKSSAGL